MNNCEIVRDLIPLCIDRVASESSEKMVYEHVESCPECKKIMEDMTDGLEIPINKETQFKDTEPFIKMQKTIVNKVTKIVAVTVVLLVVLYLGVQVTNRITYPLDNTTVSFYKEESEVMMEYSGPGNISFSASGDWNDEEHPGAMVWKIELYQTFWDKYIAQLYDHDTEKYFITESDNVSKIYDMNGKLLWENTEIEE